MSHSCCVKIWVVGDPQHGFGFPCGFLSKRGEKGSEPQKSVHPVSLSQKRGPPLDGLKWKLKENNLEDLAPLRNIE